MPDGEILHFGTECDGEEVDGGCGCRRSMAGIVSHTATTTFKVAEVDLDEAGFEARLTESYIAGGWGVLDADMKDLIKGEAEEIARVANLFPPDIVLEKRGNAIQIRHIKVKKPAVN